MKGYVTNIERDTLANADYRRVLFTGPHTQLVLMTLQPPTAAKGSDQAPNAPRPRCRSLLR